MPEVSVLMGTFNESNRDYVTMAIDSILNQTFTDFEFIICDDGSEAAFFQWLDHFCRKDSRIRLLRNQKNQGLAAVLNQGLRCALGRYIARMDADDISRTERLAKQIVFLQEHKEFVLAGCNVSLIDDQSIWGERKMTECPNKKDFLVTSPFVHPSVMVRKEAMEQIGGYCESAKKRRVEDYDFFMRLYADGFQGYNLQETLLYYREDQSSYKKRKYRYRLNECYVRYQGFRRMGIQNGNLKYVIKPLVAGMIPSKLIQYQRQKRFGNDTCRSLDAKVWKE